MASDVRIRVALAECVSVLGFITLTTLVIAHGMAPLTLDSTLHAWTLQHRTPVMTGAALVVTATGSGVPVYVLAAVAGWFTARPGRRPRLLGTLAALAALLLGQGVRLLVVISVNRPRPPQGDWAASAGGGSYPSGHTTTSALVAALICVAARRALQGRPRALVPAATITWAVLVGLTRIYLGVHWPTDVLAGWLLVAALVAAAGFLAEGLGLRHDPDRADTDHSRSTAHESGG